MDLSHRLLQYFLLTLVLVCRDGLGFLAKDLRHLEEARHLSRESIKARGVSLQKALHELRDKRRPPTRVLTEQEKEEKRAEKRGTGRVSFKECNLEEGRRLDCGFYGVTAEECAQRECCYQESHQSGVPWCYHSLPTIDSKCLLDFGERIECGWYGIRKEQCLAKNCCWQPSSERGVPWCFNEIQVPIFEGQCGIPAIAPNVLSRIVGGDEATPHSFPWMTSLQIDRDHFCGGSLINNQWILTAAHCAPAFYWGRDREVVLGMHSQSSSEPSKLRVVIDEIIAHEDYGSSSGMDNDIMLLKLRSPVEFSEEISPVCLPEENEPITPGRRCYTTGWGHTQFMGSAPDLLQQVMVPLLENSVCNQSGWYDGQIDDTMICAGYEEGGRDSCQGDSGGPLVCYEDGHWVLVGVVSWGDGCASEMKPGIYAKVSKYIDWIEDTINEYS